MEYSVKLRVDHVILISLEYFGALNWKGTLVLALKLLAHLISREMQRT